MSLRLRPVFSSALGIANAGPTPMILGGTPATTPVTYFPRIGNPRRLATDRLASSTAAAPSDTCEAFPEQENIEVDARQATRKTDIPAWVDPSLVKAGFNLARLSYVTPSLIPSSA